MIDNIMRKLIPVAFFLAVFLMAFYAYYHKNHKEAVVEVARTGEITPDAKTQVSENSEIMNLESDNIMQSAFIQLSGEETLVSTVSADFNQDGYEDQIVAIKRSFSPYIILIISLYNQKNQSYERSGEIGTDITQARTFSLSCTDITGEHKNALLYQGFLDTGSSILKAYFISTKANGSLNVHEIANFEADGTIFIQQTDRFESYEMAQAKGASYPIWVYSSDKAEGSTDQIQKQYDWNANAGRYTLIKEVRVSGSRLEAKELERILNGTTATFSEFLDGMWYKANVSGDSMRYLFFDYNTKEIIFLVNDEESVYNWVNSSLRHNGMYISSINLDISTLERKFDITLDASDTISVRLQDDVRMPINENTQWDGKYKKMNYKQEFKKASTKKKETDFIKALEKNPIWYTAESESVVFEKGKYSVIGSSGDNAGEYALVPTAGEAKNIIQFRATGKNSFLSGMYQISEVDSATFGEKDLKFTPVVANLDGVMKKDSKEILLAFANVEDEDEEEEEEEIMPELVLEEVSTEVKNPPPVVVAGTSPKRFSPDGDGKRDILTIQLKAQSYSPIASWSFEVKDPETRKTFWSVNGKKELSEKLTWNGRNERGELVQSATDYPYVFTVTDSLGQTAKFEGYIQVDVLVIRSGNKLKLQVPSIIFRSNNADFKSVAEVEAGPEGDKLNKGLDAATISNNQRVLSRVAEILQKFRDYSVTIEGNANNLTGSATEEAEVQQLSEERAKFVMEWLKRNGISSSRLSAVGNGSKNPATNNWDYRWQNRRVEFILQKPDYDSED